MHAVSLDKLPETTPALFRAALAAAADEWAGLLGPRLVSLVLFGSVARGHARESSDIDLIIVAEDLPRSLTERARPFRAAWRRRQLVEGIADVEWNLIIKDSDEAGYHSPLYLDVVEDGLLLFDRDGFFRSVLDAMRARMRTLGSRRVMLPDGSWYWDLKPDYRFGDVVEI